VARMTVSQPRLRRIGRLCRKLHANALLCTVAGPAATQDSQATADGPASAAAAAGKGAGAAGGKPHKHKSGVYITTPDNLRNGIASRVYKKRVVCRCVTQAELIRFDFLPIRSMPVCLSR
jgi:hypothetical protein